MLRCFQHTDGRRLFCLPLELISESVNRFSQFLSSAQKELKCDREINIKLELNFVINIKSARIITYVV